MNEMQCVEAIEAEALHKLPRDIRDYIRSGADSETTLRRNKESFKKLLIRPFCFRDVSNVDHSVTVKLGNDIFKFPSPIAIAPTAFHKLVCERGELDTVEIANKFNIPYICSTMSNASLEEIAESATPGTTLWFQVYIYKDRQVTRDLVLRAKKAGFKALVLTVDTPEMGKRRVDLVNKFKLPSNLHLGNFESSKFGDREGTGDLNKFTANTFDSSITWKEVKWLKDIAGLPVIIKGLMRGEDAESAILAGAAGIYVSNHGGRQLDHCMSTMDALPQIARVVNKRVPILIDGSFTAGTDVLKAIYLGADLVCIGRPILYGLAVGGKEGGIRVMDLLTSEFKTALKLAGMKSITELKSEKNMIIRKEIVSKF
uniref:FMN hydroxy acid dehydrogenase domain-containing protein n=1 Tax=Rhabditophanes sp. KR3021 TaxID=114890 RepID=A0AC35UHV3_9BILA